MKTILILILSLATLSGFAQQTITNVNTGSTGGDGTGDPLRMAFGKLNTNDTFLAAQNATNAAAIVALSNNIVPLIPDVSGKLDSVVPVIQFVDGDGAEIRFGTDFNIQAAAGSLSFNRLDGPSEIFRYDNSVDTLIVQEWIETTEGLRIFSGMTPDAITVEGGVSWFTNTTVYLGQEGSHTLIDTNGAITSPSVTASAFVGGASALTGYLISNLATNGLETGTFTNIVSGRIPVFVVGGVTNYLFVGTNAP